MNIGLDANEILHGERAIRRYTVNLLKSLVPLLHSEDILKPLYFRFRRPKAEPLTFQGPESLRVKNHIIPLPHRLIQACAQNTGWPKPDHFLGPLDLFHSPGLTAFPKGKYPFVVTIHSTAHRHIAGTLNPSYVKWYESFLEWTIKSADYFITVSETMKEDFVRLYRIPESRVRAIPLGVSDGFREMEPEASRRKVKERFGIEKPYLLYVGGIQKNKNIKMLIESFALLKKSYKKELLLVLAGDEAYGSEEVKDLIRERELKNEVVLTGYVDQDSDDLPALYHQAKVFWFMSLWEGWASPPLEAMKCGVPVIASDISPLRENLGDAAQFCSPEIPEIVAEKTKQILENSAITQMWREKGLNHAAPFTWNETAKKTIDFYREILSQKL